MPYKDKEKNKEYQREYQNKWRKENPERMKEIHKKSEQRPERKEYVREWQRTSPKAKEIRKRFDENNVGYKKEYDKLWNKKNPDRVKKKHKKYYSSIKGIVNRLKKADKKRFGIINNGITFDLIKSIDDKYKKCIYCGGEFKPRFDYDHINSFKPFSKDNIIKVCSGCNQSKNNANLLEWMKFKNYEITEEILEIYGRAYN